MKFKLSITNKVIMLSTVPLVIVSIISSLASAVFLGSNTLDEIEKELRLSAYAIQKETENMNAENTSMESVNYLLVDFKAKNNIDVTIFGSAEVGDDRIYIKAIKGVNVNESDWREAAEEEKIAFETEQEAKRQEELDTNDALDTQRKNLILRN